MALRWTAVLASGRRLWFRAANADRATCVQPLQLGRVETPIPQRFLSMLSGTRCRTLDLARRAAETRRRRRLHHAVDLDEGSSMAVMRMLRRFEHVKHGREADLAAFHDRAPFVAGLGLEQRLEPLLERRPLRAIVLTRQLLAFQPGQPQQLGVELALDR